VTTTKKAQTKERKPTVAQLRRVKLDESNFQCPSNFYDPAWDHASQTFEDAVKTHRGPNGFRGDKNAAALRQQCLDEWNLMRDEMIEVARRLEKSGKQDLIFAAKYASIPRPMRKSTE
jgi:hypothetical protein